MSKLAQKSTKDMEIAAMQGCEDQVLSEIGFIQPFACLLAYRVRDRVFTHVSANIGNCLEISPQKILGEHLHDVLPRELVHSCNNASSHSTINTVREYVGRIENACGRHEVYAHKKQSYMILELQTVKQNESVDLSMLDNVQRILGRLSRLKTPQGLFESAVHEIKYLTHFDRVKVYQFLPDGAGEVIAESKDAHVDSFLGLRFPAFDIPKAARELYAQTPIRVIPDVSVEPVKLLTHIDDIEDLDLSLAISRGLVPVHMMYLQNMGVQATMSIPIVVNGKMWGLFACHHYQPYAPGSDIITSCEILGNTIAMILSAMLQSMRTARTEQCNGIVNKLIVPDESTLGFTAYWDTTSPDLASLIECDGLSLIASDSHMPHGICPSPDAIKKLVAAIDKDFTQVDSDSSVYVVESISKQFPDIDCGASAGFIAIPNPLSSYKYLVFFRNEARDKIRWAGNPDKTIEQDKDGYRLNPRASFKDYMDKTDKCCVKFDSEDIIVAEALKESLYKTMSSVSSRTQNRDRLGLMVRELNHRVRNILALITSIVSQSRNDSHSLEQFIESLESRIQALSETHKLLTEFDWQPILISLLFERALSPYIAKKQKRITLSGDQVSLPPELASLFALVVHELASNASKYGALSVQKGSVELNWSADNDNLTVTWREKDGPLVEAPKANGFGTTLINEALSYEFDADCRLSFLPEGVEAIFVMPHKNTKIEVALPSIVESRPQALQSKLDILVLEDDFMISKEMCAMLKRFGASTVDAAPNLEKAHRLLDNKRYDIAVLDANIRGQFSGEIADRLSQMRIPFLFVTGYGCKDQALHETNCIKILSKPVGEEELFAALQLSTLTSQ